MPNEVKTQKSGSKKGIIAIVALVALVGIFLMLNKKAPAPVPVNEDDKAMPTASANAKPNRPEAAEEPAEEEYKEPEKNAESTWVIEDYTDTNRDWSKYKMKNVQVTADGIKLAPGATNGTFESPVMTTPIPANMVAPLWKQEVPKGACVKIEMAVSGDNINWSTWFPLDDTGDDISPLYPDGTPNPNYGHVPGAYISTGLDLATFTRYRFTLSKEGCDDKEYRLPDGSFAAELALKQLRLYVLDSTQGEGKTMTKDTIPPGIPGDTTPAGSEPETPTGTVTP